MLKFPRPDDFVGQRIKFLIQSRSLTQITFPHRNHSPAQGLQMCSRNLIPMPVPRNLRLPELHIRLRLSRIAASFMSMPETAVHHNRNPILRQHNIRLPWKPPVLQPKPEPTRMQPFPNQNFRFGVPATYGRHTFVALRWS